MIYIYTGNKFKLTKYQSSEKLIEVFKLHYLDDAKGLDKEVMRGNHVFCWISTHEYEINQKNVMYWSKNPEKAESNYHEDGEEI